MSSEELPIVPLTNLEAVPLASAWVSSRAKTSDVRALIIKGIVAEHHGLRPARGYADVDVMIDPAKFKEFLEHLRRSGWHERDRVWVADLLDAHSVTLVHDRWPCDIDVHTRFPGFLADDQDVFEALWEHRHEFEVAHQTVICTDAVASAAILGLHSLRRPHDARHRREFDFLVEQIAGKPELIKELAAFAVATKSVEPLRPLFDSLSFSDLPQTVASAQQLRAWRRRASSQSRAGQWLTYLSGLPLRKRPREVLVVLWPPRRFYLQEHPETPPDARSLFLARLRRLIRGAGDVVRMLAPGGHHRP